MILTWVRSCSSERCVFLRRARFLPQLPPGIVAHFLLLGCWIPTPLVPDGGGSVSTRAVPSFHTISTRWGNKGSSHPSTPAALVTAGARAWLECGRESMIARWDRGISPESGGLGVPLS